MMLSTLISKTELKPRHAALAAFKIFLLSMSTLFFALVSHAQTIPDPRDRPYLGVITLDVDATNLDQKIFVIRERVPVSAGDLTLFYPEWLPGRHSPTGPIVQLAGLIISANGKVIEWERDKVNMYAFHLFIPEGVTQIDVNYQFLSPVEGNQGRITVTPEIVGVQWSSMVLYPAGYEARQIRYQANIKLPKDWQFGTALELDKQVGAHVQFKETDLDTLVDSPLFIGKYFKRFDLDPTGKIPVHLNIVGDSAEDVDAKPEQIELHRNLVQQAYKLYGSQHYEHYDFLLALSDNFTSIGLEHHQSSENGVNANYFTQWHKAWQARGLLPHEFTHSWNGKFLRPADLLTPNFNVPMHDSLLWVYEGQTQYWGEILAVRSGLHTAEQFRDNLANFVANYDLRAGRAWRNLQDTTNMPTISKRGPLAWMSWQRPEDYYGESALVWLDVDTKIRELSGDTKSLNNFASAFFSVQNGRKTPLSYTFGDVVVALNTVQTFGWATFLRTRLDEHASGAPKDGITRSGWKLIYTEEKNLANKSEEDERRINNFTYSLGFSTAKEGIINNVIWNSLAFKQGLTIGTTVVAVNGRSYKPELLKAALTEAKTSKQAIELIVRKDDRYRTISFDYHEGGKYPHLVRIEGTADRLSAILAPLK